MTRALILLAAIALLVGGWWLTSAPTPADDDAAGSDPEHRLAALDQDEATARLADLAHSDPALQTAAETFLRRLLLRAVPIRVQPGDRSARVSFETWIESHGRAHIVRPLLARFAGAQRPAEAHELLTWIAARFPTVVQDAREESLILPSTPASSATPLSLARRVIEAGAEAEYAIYQLDALDRRPGAVLALALLTRLARESGDDATSDRIVRILARVPDEDFAPVLRSFLEESPSWVPSRALVTSRLGASGGSLASWARSGDRLHFREQALAEGLRASDPQRVLAALERFRWDPAPSLDSLVLDLVRRHEAPEVAKSALDALAAVPTRAAATILLPEFEKPERLDRCVRVLQAWIPPTDTRRRSALDERGWDFLREPVAYEREFERCRTQVRDLVGQSRRDQVDRAFRAQNAGPTEFETLPLLTRRGEFAADWYDATTGPQIARALAHPDPRTRAAATRALVPWERGNPRVIPHLVARCVEEEDADTASALLDALLVIGERSGYGSVVDELVRQGRFHGLFVIEAFGLLFPQLDRESALLACSQLPIERQAVGAYLMAGLPPSRATTRFLLAGLESTDTPLRFWSCETLRRQYQQNFGYLPERPPEANRAAIAQWRRFAMQE
ncbi:MAG: HEAT repeat domain-containing protein [Planctomycetota bacterium]